MSTRAHAVEPTESSALQDSQTFGRRQFLEEVFKASATGGTVLLGVMRVVQAQAPAAVAATTYEPNGRLYGMGIDIDKCIGCARCVVACKTENDVPDDPHYFNTWVERYVLRTDGSVQVESPDGGLHGFSDIENEASVLRTFFVPKLCNHCANPPCVQVCPVGATFSTADGVVLVDEDYCIGCRYCIQACPYGARWFHPTKHVAAKCSFCYHRVSRGLLPACVEACPTGARTFGEIEDRSTPLARFMRQNDIQVLKPHHNTNPKVYYANLDGEVR
jgi:tetrathionate reductase subunit B